MNMSIIKAIRVGLRQMGHRKVLLNSDGAILMPQEANWSIKKDEIHEQRRTKRIPASDCMAQALHAFGSGFFIQEREVLASRDPKSAVEASQADPGAPPQERGLGLQVLLNLARPISWCQYRVDHHGRCCMLNLN
jgi:hypothetical protein